jgi:hypothetical protein
MFIYTSMDLKRLCMRIKLNKLEGSIVYKQALIIKHLSKFGVHDAVLKSGYVQNGSDVCWHCWVVHDENIHDYIKYTLFDTIIYYDEIPFGKKEVEHDMITKNKELYNVYTKNIKQFWKEAPNKIKYFIV